MGYQSDLPIRSRFLRFAILMVCVLTVNCTTVRAKDGVNTISNGLVIEQIPQWVEKYSLDLASLMKSTEPVNGIRVLDLDAQANYTKPNPEVYVHTITQLSNTSVLPGQTTVTLAYIPKYQTYSVTGLKIRRSNEVIDESEKALVRFNQLEAPFGADQFESPKQVLIFIPGLRSGDMVDFSYIIRGTEKALIGKILGKFNHGTVISVGHISNRILVPKGETLNIFGVNSPKAPVITHTDGYDEYRWEENGITPSPVEDYAPPWQPSFPVTYFSNFKSWTDVRKWGESFLITRGKPAPEIVDLAKKLTDGLKTDTAKLVAVLTFMQRDIRYVGLELGRNNYRPFPATTVLERRFGDCKDQTNLMLQILKALNIKAVPVLTNAIQRRWMLTKFPSPGSFDHVFVYVKLDGKEYWVDPTAPIFGDQDAKLDYVNYGYGLKLDGQAANLTVIGDDPFGSKINKYEITVIPGVPVIKNQARVRIHAQITDDVASAFRLMHDQVGEVKREKTNQEFVARLFDVEKVEQLSKADIIDSFEYNELDDQTDFLVYEPWTLDDSEKNFTLMMKSQYVRQLVVSIDEVENRVAPAMLAYPVDVEETFMVALPDMNYDIPDETVENKYLYFNRKVWYKGGLYIRYKYRAKKKLIAAKDIESYDQDIKSIKDKLSYYVYLPNKANISDLINSGMNNKLIKPKIEFKGPAPPDLKH